MFYDFLREEPTQFLQEHPNLLGCEDFADSVASLLRAVPEGHQVGLWGAWGSGKSRVLHLLEQRLAADWIVCGFNPWQDATETTWIAKLTAAFAAAAAGRGVSIDERELKRLVDKKSAEFTKKQRLNFGKQVLKGVADFFRIKADRFEALADTAIDLKEVDRLAWQATVEHLHARKPEPGTRLAVFVDDLDRCEPRLIRELLDVVFGHLRHDGVTFLIATDRDSVVASLEHLLPDNTRRSASKYLEKLIAIDVTMPPPSNEQVAEFIHAHMGVAIVNHAEMEAVKVLEKHAQAWRAPDKPNMLKESQRLALPILESVLSLGVMDLLASLGRNPRRIKRVLIRCLRISEAWNAEFLDRMDSAQDVIRAACTFEVATSLAIVKELRPIEFEAYFTEPTSAWLTLGWLSDKNMAEDTASFIRKLESSGLKNDILMIRMGRDLKQTLSFGDSENSYADFAAAWRMSLMA